MPLPQRALWVTLLLCLQVKDLTKYLDPSGLGVISFEDFHRGIRAIKNGGEFAAVLRGRTGRHRISTPQRFTELRSHLGRTSWVRFSESRCSVLRGRQGESPGAFNYGDDKGGTAVVVGVACFPVYQESSFLNIHWKQKSHRGKIPSGLVPALPCGFVGVCCSGRLLADTLLEMSVCLPSSATSSERWALIIES